ncbi:MAG: ntaA 3 [Amycolatopsis sp.]|jgi:alkanesulfonate monooxygenase SsuD/methylene tetrahydromethanopterin reductase-like flavin-dependent oxidoreductase (luciferase family)|uniref:LLM class flavin-dependent oxidoreductase n=1 Tax=Amycolatopsis sp. TaxID=37632 RepID=UPI0026325630|nr:LLM class flavin-dependent oxidoreductase [Amycolatopsis sp.]MCU1684174.1 ntaA 3 [Amycolatopsis sp.]
MAHETGLHVAVALDGAGWHPAAWREHDARPDELFTAGYWTDLVREAERGRLDFVTIEDSLGLQSTAPDGPDERTDQVRGRLDAVLIASRVAPLTSHIGLVPTAVLTHTEPFHLSKAIATLDFVSNGRAGVRLKVSGSPSAAGQFGRREFPAQADDGIVSDLFEEAVDYVEVLRRLWDSWEDDAEIRDVATGRFVDRDKLHYIDFEGKWFSVKGPSITPRPPQGQPLVTALAHKALPYRFGARSTDLVFVTPHDVDQAAKVTAEVRAAQAETGRTGEPLHVFGDLVVFLDETARAAADRKARLDDVAGAAYTSDAAIFTGTPAALADQLLAWREAGLTGFRLRPAALPHDLTAITRGLVPELRSRGVFRTGYEAGTLRGLLGLDRPANRYAA